MRRCTTCNGEMVEGYLAEEFGETFCTDTCLDERFYKGLSAEISATPEEEEDDLTIFWTEWHDEDDIDRLAHEIESLEITIEWSGY